MITQDGLLTRLANVFRGRLNPERIVEDLRKQEEELKKVNYGLAYDRRVLENRLELAMQKGVSAVRAGKAMQEDEAALEVRLIRTEGTALQRDHATVLKSLLACRLASMRLKSAAQGGALALAKKIKVLFQDTRFRDHLTSATVQEEQFRQYLERELGIHTNSLEEASAARQADLDAERMAFRSCVKAEDAGDMEKVSQIRADIISASVQDNTGLEAALADS